MLAATRLIALHKNKGMTVAACLKNRTDYIENPDKTEQGQYVSSYACSALTSDEEFMLTKRQYDFVNGRRQKSDVIAYQIRQSFRPGEITAEEANKVGYELAMRFTKGKHAFVVATHTDRQHIHNHVIFNSTALDGTKKFRNFFFSALAVQRLIDLICLEHQLSVIEIKPYRERQKRTLYPPKESNRDRLCGVIDNILSEKPKDYEDFLQRLEQQGYEVKRGKYTSVKGTRQKRFIRFRTLGAGYSEEELKAVIAGEAEHHPRQKQKRIIPEQKFQMLVDIQAKLAEGKGPGYERWAKVFNLKQMAAALAYLQNNGLTEYEELEKKAAETTDRFHVLSDRIKQTENAMNINRELKSATVQYARTQPVFEKYKAAKYSRKFLAAHEADIELYRAAQADLKRLLNGEKLPKMDVLKEEGRRLAEQKWKLYAEYQKVRRDMQEVNTAKANIDYLLGYAGQDKKKEQER